MNIMWKRKELKARAKAVLSKIYWKAFLISLVIAMAVGGGGGGGSSSYNQGRPGYSSDFETGMFMAVILVLIIVFALVSIALRILIGYPLEVGGRKYFIQSAQFNDNRRCFRFAFNGNHYLKIVLTMLLKGVFNFLWFLLFIIPGIVKYYSYSMVPYILADNPNIGYTRAIKLSMQMTKGHKWRIFVLELSFLGWVLLGILALFIGVLFVLPYIDATKAELYLVLRKNAIESQMCSYEELQLNPA